MNNKLATIILITLGLGTNLALAMDNTYVAVKGGFSYIQDQEDNQNGTKLKIDYNKKFNAGAAVGQKLGAFRTELEGNYIYAEVNQIDSTPTGGTTTKDSSNNKAGSVISMVLNGYYDMDVDPNVTPYFGIGAGWAYAKSDFTRKLADGSTPETKKSSNVIAFQGIVGAQYHMNHVMSIFLEYKFFMTTKMVFTQFEDNDYKHAIMAHNVNLGFKFVVA